MIQIRKAAERGHFKYDWLDTWHTFSFDSRHRHQRRAKYTEPQFVPKPKRLSNAASP